MNRLESLKRKKRFKVTGFVALVLAGLFFTLLAGGCGSDSQSGFVGGRNACSPNGTCGGGNFCVSGRCVECAGPGQCGGGEVCDPVSYSCTPPCGPAGPVCGGGTPYCDAQNGVCIRCISDANCAGTGNPFCSRALNECVDCLTSAQCAGGRTCDLTSGRCLECSSPGSTFPCAPGQVCGNDFECHSAGCRSNFDCGGGNPYCAANGECVECLFNDNCQFPEVCAADFHCRGG
jgi:hypothetical protein